jgi:hypothetical protein
MGQLRSTDQGLCDVILEAHRKGFTVQSDYARMNADYLAMAASMGLVSTRVYGNVFSREWRPTVTGLGFLQVHLGDGFAAMEEPEDD